MQTRRLSGDASHPPVSSVIPAGQTSPHSLKEDDPDLVQALPSRDLVEVAAAGLLRLLLSFAQRDRGGGGGRSHLTSLVCPHLSVLPQIVLVPHQNHRGRLAAGVLGRVGCYCYCYSHHQVLSAPATFLFAPMLLVLLMCL